ncbi:hypothetical protein F5X97DRAFT_286961 [Nemania serpens]|nr:hypothetical protein F5X97DRAFT_286961 [Nemania serpens]
MLSLVVHLPCTTLYFVSPLTLVPTFSTSSTSRLHESVTTGSGATMRRWRRAGLPSGLSFLSRESETRLKKNTAGEIYSP